MEAVGTATILRFIHQCFSHIKQARGFEDGFEIYQLQLETLLSHCASVSRIIHNTSELGNLIADTRDPSDNRSEDHEPTVETLSAIQQTLRKAKRDAAKIQADCFATNDPPLQDLNADDHAPVRPWMTAFLDRRKIQAAKTIEGVKWALYKKEMRSRFIEEIFILILQLERQIYSESLAIEDAGLMYLQNEPVALV
ncbi:prion-inhibition and propagation domain-containing protein [Trichoderma breve]|uniref:Prion-inhibition and propagation domain-containing protein n=1 Tax=Trichoderma breve TaxID=2034170 RepID=A0A9W9JSD1_9HYPO|nr:prion-inhibition and propagation domain-containing protein [Trichoderma breve]KAJ4864287.1 prion-inhibition and propagation domain-containing protein [Trichoderma breve]